MYLYEYFGSSVSLNNIFLLQVSFVRARKEVDELVRLRVVNNRKSSCPLTKNQLRHEIRTLLSKRFLSDPFSFDYCKLI